MESLKNQTIVITGGGGGLGRALVLELSKENVRLAILGRTEKTLKETKEKVTTLGTECEYFICDISDKKEVTETFEKIKEKFGEIDILVNNAGIWYEGSTVEHPAEKVKELFDINSVGPVFTCQEVIPEMKKQKSGQILNISSIAGILPEPGWPVYVGTKYAVRGFTEALENELDGTGIKVMGFYPGGMDTDLFDKAGFPKGKVPWMMDKEKVAEVLVFMLKLPKNMNMSHMILKSLNDSLIYDENKKD